MLSWHHIDLTVYENKNEQGNGYSVQENILLKVKMNEGNQNGLRTRKLSQVIYTPELFRKYYSM